MLAEAQAKCQGKKIQWNVYVLLVFFFFYWDDKYGLMVRGQHGQNKKAHVICVTYVYCIFYVNCVPKQWEPKWSYYPENYLSHNIFWRLTVVLSWTTLLLSLLLFMSQTILIMELLHIPFMHTWAWIEPESNCNRRWKVWVASNTQVLGLSSWELYPLSFSFLLLAHFQDK